MRSNVMTLPNEQQRQIQRTIEEVMQELRRKLEQPLYLQISTGKNGSLSVRHIQFLTIDEFATLCRVEERTVYGWLERAEKTGLKCYRPPGSRGILFEMNEAVEWILNNPNLEQR
jgi:hypothetical protein